MQVSTVSTSLATITMRGASERTATRIDTEGFILKKEDYLTEKREIFSLSSVQDYQNQLRIQGAQEQSIVVSKGGNIMASVAQDNSAMFQDPAIANIWDHSEGNTEAFIDTLEKAGYDVRVYEQGTGPTYAEIHKQINGESYETLIERQTIEFVQELALLTGEKSSFSTIA